MTQPDLFGDDDDPPQGMGMGAYGPSRSGRQQCPVGGVCHHLCRAHCARNGERLSLSEPPAAIAHDGETYDPKVDAVPLNKQQQAVFALMSDGMFRTLADIAAGTGHPEASVSARLRDLRKPKWGGHEVIRRRRGDSRTWEYALIERKP